jgi:FMN-dependent oxidoreductase (nitrilotriacetate monooxygenase family)
MSASIAKMHLCAFLFSTGHHIASWRHPAAPLQNGMDFSYWLNLAKICERGKFDALFLYDSAALPTMDMAPMTRIDHATSFDPMALLCAIAVATDRIGLVSTANTSFDQPYYIARRYLSLDHLSGGRAGWNMVTGVSPREAANFGADMMPHGDRYARAREFAQVVRGLWDSWNPDAFIMDKASGRFFDAAGVQTLNHHGKHFKVSGPLCVARSPQGQPVMVQAGGSEPGRELAAETADMIFSIQVDLADGKAFYADIKSRMAKYGRDPGSLKIMPGAYVIVGRTMQEAEDKYDVLRNLVDPLVAMSVLSSCMGGLDLSAYDPDGPVPCNLTTNAGTFQMHLLISTAQQRNLTLRQLAAEFAANGYGHWSVLGTPTQIADQLEERFVEKAADGFNLMPATFPGDLEDFVKLVVPELQRRGLFRHEYTGRSLRDHLGLSIPVRDPQCR